MLEEVMHKQSIKYCDVQDCVLDFCRELFSGGKKGLEHEKPGQGFARTRQSRLSKDRAPSTNKAVGCKPSAQSHVLANSRKCRVRNSFKHGRV